MANRNLIKIIDLGFHPYADTFIKKKDLNKSEPVFQLACFLDKKNGTIQNTVKTDDNLRYNLYEYSYTSSNSIYSKNYWEKYAEHIISKNNINSKSKILEIGSNDGYLLKCLKIKTKKVWGVDASNFMSKLANSKNITTFKLLFNFKNSKRIKKKISKVDIIIANNVVNHSNNVLDFFKGVKNLLKLNGIFIFEIPYWYNLVKKKQFDQIYHEHVNYFTVKSAQYYLQKIGLYIYDIAETAYHGGSIRFYVGSDKKKSNIKKIKEYIYKENKLGLFNKKTYIKMMKNIKIKKMNFLKKILQYKNKNYIIVGIGAPAKGNTFLNFMNLNNHLINYMTDNSKYKIGKYAPLSRIPIVPDIYLKKIKKKICAFFLIWNLENILKKEILKINKNIKFISF